MDKQQEELQSWKKKYYDAIGDLEAREKQWAELEQALRQGLNRLSLAADDSDDLLNRQLEALRNEIRKGIPSEVLQTQLGVISDSILRLDEARKKLQKLPTPAELMLDILGRLHFPHGMGHRSKAMQKRLVKATRDESVALGEEFATLITEALAWTAGEEGATAATGGEKKGLLGKIFKGKEKGEVNEPDAVTSATNGLQVAKNLLAELIRSLVVEESQRNTLSEQLQASEQEVQLQRLARELAGLLSNTEQAGAATEEQGILPVNEVLVRLLERLDIPAELSKEVEAVKAMLLQNLPAAEMDKVILAIAELIAEMRNRMQSEKEEIENFLQQLTTRLQEIDHSFQSNVATQRESFRDGQALDDAVKVQVEGIEASVQQAQELSTLKALLQQRVDTIRNHMQEFRNAEDQRRQQAEQQVAELTQRLELVQGESEHLRQRLQDERNLAMIDPLTGIPNRLAYNERLQQEFVRWRRYGAPLTVAVWDVDKFKLVNDTYGHQAGDKVLTVIAKLLHKQIRETDFVARFGGEEFVLLLPETNLEGSTVATEHLRKAVEATEFHFRGKRVPITISCGVSEFKPGDSPEQVFERADKALYEAKLGGRNRCCKG
jgi:diguanylate cyclase